MVNTLRENVLLAALPIKGETTVLTSKSIVPLLMLRNINFENILTNMSGTY